MKQQVKVLVKNKEGEKVKIGFQGLGNMLQRQVLQKRLPLNMDLAHLQEVDKWKLELQGQETIPLKAILLRIRLPEDYLFQEGQTRLQQEEETLLAQVHTTP